MMHNQFNVNKLRFLYKTKQKTCKRKKCKLQNIKKNLTNSLKKLYEKIQAINLKECFHITKMCINPYVIHNSRTRMKKSRNKN